MVGSHRQLRGRLRDLLQSGAPEAMAAMRRIMERLKLTVNEEKTRSVRDTAGAVRLPG